MPHNLTETATYDANVTVPDDGDARTAASVVTFAQQLANRSKYLKAAIAAGVPNLRTVDGWAALKALTGMADGEVAVTVAGKSVLWVYKASGTTTEALPFVVAPTTGGGRWYMAGVANYVDTAGGYSGADNRWGIRVPNQVVSARSGANTGASINLTSGAWTVVENCPFALTGEVGDILDVSISGSFQCGNSAGALAHLRAAVQVVAGSQFEASGSEVIVGILSAAIAPTPYTIRTVMQITEAGTYGIQLEAKIDVANGLLYRPTNYSCVQIRP